MRSHAGLVLAVLLVCGCATSAPRPTSTNAGDAEPRPTARRCSDADPDRFAWFCIVGRVLYGAAAYLQPDGRTISVK